MTSTISVVVPAYNEADNLPALMTSVDDVLAGLDGYCYECIVVNDGSEDNTQIILSELRSKYPQLRPVHMARNSGQSAALLAGMRLAKGDLILTMDADLQNDPRDFPKIIELLGQYDCVCGYREKRHDNWLRLLTSRAGNFVRRRIVDDGIRDAGCGIKGFRRACIEHFVPFNGVHRFFAAMARNGGLSVGELFVSHHPRRYGASKYGLCNRLFWVLFDFLGVAWLHRRYIRIEVVPETAFEAKTGVVAKKEPALARPQNVIDSPLQDILRSAQDV